MKILAISASPNRGRNSDTMLDYFIKGVERKNGLSIEKIYLDQIPIAYYRYDNKNGPEKNEIEFKELTNKISNGINALIIATPTYNFSVPAHLKNFIDRIGFISLDYSNRNRLGQPIGKFKHLHLYFIVSGGTPNWIQRILFFLFPQFWLKIIFNYYGGNVFGSLYSGDIQSFNNKKILEKCMKKGEAFATKLFKKYIKQIPNNNYANCYYSEKIN